MASEPETPAKKAHEPSTPSAPNTSAADQSVRSRLTALGFKPEQDKTDRTGRHGTGIVGGVRRSDQGARSKLAHRFEEWDGPPGIGIIGGVRKPKA